MEALAWVGQVAEWVGQFIPRLHVIRTTYHGIKWVRGRRIVVCRPGLAVHWPLLTDYVEWPVARQGVQLREQTVVTEDDKTIVVGGMIVYEVADVERLVGRTYSPDASIKDIALTCIHDVCCQLPWDQLKVEQRKGTLDTKLKNAAHRQLDDYGVRVLKLMLTDLSTCRVIRLVQSTAKEDDR